MKTSGYQLSVKMIHIQESRPANISPCRLLFWKFYKIFKKQLTVIANRCFGVLRYRLIYSYQASDFYHVSLLNVKQIALQLTLP